MATRESVVRMVANQNVGVFVSANSRDTPQTLIREYQIWAFAAVREPRPDQDRGAATPKPGCTKQAMAWHRTLMPLSQSSHDWKTVPRCRVEQTSANPT